MEPNQTMGQESQSGLPAQAGNAKTLWAVVVLIVVVGGGWYGYGQGWFGGGIEQAPTFSQEQLVGGAPLSETQEGAIATHKQKILERIAQGTPLTKEEKESLGRTMLMEAHLYGFTDAETEVIFRALQQ